jgi:hypothetical protein
VLVAATTDRHQVERLTDAQPSAPPPTCAKRCCSESSAAATGPPHHLFTDGAFTLPPGLPDDLGSVEDIPVTQTGAATWPSSDFDASRPRDNRRQQWLTCVQNLARWPLESHGHHLRRWLGRRRNARASAKRSDGTGLQELPAGALGWRDGRQQAQRQRLTLDDRLHGSLVQRKPPVLLVSKRQSVPSKVFRAAAERRPVPHRAQRSPPPSRRTDSTYRLRRLLAAALHRGNLFVNHPIAAPSAMADPPPRVATWDH